MMNKELENNNGSEIQITFEGGEIVPIKDLDTIREVKLELTERDLNLLSFVLEMKFASFQQLYRKYFSTTYGGAYSVSTSWAERRLLQLVKADYLKFTYSLLEKEKLYVCTQKAYRAVASHNLSKLYSKLNLRAI